VSELLIKNGMVYTYIYEGYHAIKLRMADIYIKDGYIEEVAPDISRNCDTLDAKDCLVFPGMINVGASTFAARISSGLVCDWRRGHGRIAPLLDMAAEILNRDELKAIAITGLWETASSGAQTVIELGRSEIDDNAEGHPLFYRSAPKTVIDSVLDAGKEMGLQVYSGYCNKDGGLTLPEFNDTDIKGYIVTDSAITCADLGLPYSGYSNIKAGSMMTMGTGATSTSCMIKEMAATARAVKTKSDDPGIYRASDVFYSATVVGGRELDENKHGRIGPGFFANISVVDMKRFKPLSYPLSQYIYGATAQDVQHVVCEGSVLKRDGEQPEKLQKTISDASETAEAAITKLWKEARKTII